jgi:hypothetical protein
MNKRTSLPRLGLTRTSLRTLVGPALEQIQGGFARASAYTCTSGSNPNCIDTFGGFESAVRC